MEKTWLIIICLKNGHYWGYTVDPIFRRTHVLTLCVAKPLFLVEAYPSKVTAWVAPKSIDGGRNEDIGFKDVTYAV
jgi:hypothetical protein